MYWFTSKCNANEESKLEIQSCWVPANTSNDENNGSRLFAAQLLRQLPAEGQTLKLRLQCLHAGLVNKQRVGKPSMVVNIMLPHESASPHNSKNPT